MTAVKLTNDQTKANHLSTQSLGFTLVELMIVVAIVAILATVALPSYQAQSRDTRRADCNAVLAQSRQSMERYYSKSYSYTGAAVGTDIPNKCPEDGAAQYYAVTLAVPAGGTAYTITATPQGGQANDGCGTLTVNQAGVKTCSTGGCTIDDCW